MNRPINVVAALVILVGMADVGAGMAGETGGISLAEVQRLIKERGYSWTAGPTGVSELSPAAKRGLAGLVIPPDAALVEESTPVISAPDKVELPESWDWRESVPGVHPVGVTPVKDQQTCSSCWAFAAAAQLESHILITDGVSEDLSEQQLVSCNGNGGSCLGGGWHVNAYSVFRAPGAVTESCYPYVDADGPCLQWDCPTVARIADYSRVANDNASIKYALMSGPLFVGLRWQEMFAFYRSGVFDVPPGDSPSFPISNHAVILVGWDDTIEHAFGTGAWIVKNSWGEQWGMDGYAYVAYTSTFLANGPRQITYLPDSSSRLALVEDQAGQTWVAGTNQSVAWVTDLAADRFEVGYVIGGQYQLVAPAVPDTSSHFEFDAPDVRAESLVVRVSALAADGAVLAVAESSSPIHLVQQRVAWPQDGVTVQSGEDLPRPHALIADGEGGCVLVWTGDDGNFATRMSAQGAPVWSGPRQLPFGSEDCSVVSDEAGGVYIVYSVSSGASDVLRLLWIAADGSLPWGSQGIRVDQLGGEYTVGRSVNPLLVRDGSGGVVCVWSFHAGSFETVYGQRVSAGGVRLWDAGDAPGRRLTTRPGAGSCALTRLAGGAVAAAYICFGDGSYDRTDLWLQLVRDPGELPWGESGRRVRSGDGPTEYQALAPDLSGGAAILWREAGEGWSRAQFQRFSAGGDALWNEGGLTIDQLDVAGRMQPRLVADEAGGHLVAVTKQSSLCEFEVTVHRVGPAGGLVWQPGGISLVSKVGLVGYLGLEASLVADGAGGAIVIWADFDAAVVGGRVGLTAQHVTADGSLDWTPFGEPIVLSHGVPARYSRVCRGRAGHLSLAWCYEFPTPTVQFQRVAGAFPAPPRCEVTAWRRRDGELQPLSGNAVRGCPAGDADAVVVVCDFVDADLAGVPVVSPADFGLDTRALGISLGGATAADVAGTPANGYCVTLVRDRVLGCSGCEGGGCAECAVAAGPLGVTYQGATIGIVPDVAVHGFDVNGDGDVDLTEIVGLARTYDRELGDPAFDGCYDVTDDDLVDLADWNLLVEHYGVSAATSSATVVSLRRTEAGEAQVYEVVLQGDGARAAALRIEAPGVPLANLEWQADSPSAAGALLLPATGGAGAGAWLVFPDLTPAAGPETLLGRLVLSGTALPEDGADGLWPAGGELLLADDRILALTAVSSPVADRGAIELAAPFPNPCNPSATIAFTAPRAGRLSLRVYDVTGRLVRTLIDGPVPGSSGSRRVVWTGRDEANRLVASGVYFVRLTSGDDVATRRLVLIR